MENMAQEFAADKLVGFNPVNQYALESIAPAGKTIIFVTESIENIPVGWHAKETYQVLGPEN